MKFLMKNIKVGLLAILMLGFFVTPLVTQAADAKDAGIKGNLKDFGDVSYGKSAETNPVKVVGTVIKSGLGIMGVLLIIYLVYGGMMWMTAEGDSGKVDKAKAILRNAIIGLIIVMASYAIAAFVVDAITGATGAGGASSGGSSGGGNSGGGSSGGGSSGGGSSSPLIKV